MTSSALFTNVSTVMEVYFPPDEVLSENFVLPCVNSSFTSSCTLVSALTINLNVYIKGNFSTELSFSRKRSEEHTSELQSRENLVCRLLLEKKKYKSLDK